MSDAPSHAGPYRRISHIASGGMGIVYLGEREDGGEPTRAAIKLMRRGIDADGLNGRRWRRDRRNAQPSSAAMGRPCRSGAGTPVVRSGTR